MKAPEHLWIFTLDPISLSEVLASVCFITCDIRMILLPCGAVWVFLAILALFIGPSAAKHRGTEQSTTEKRSTNDKHPPAPFFPGFSHLNTYRINVCTGPVTLIVWVFNLLINTTHSAIINIRVSLLCVTTKDDGLMI